MHLDEINALLKCTTYLHDYQVYIWSLYILTTHRARTTQHWLMDSSNPTVAWLQDFNQCNWFSLKKYIPCKNRVLERKGVKKGEGLRKRGGGGEDGEN